MPTPSPSPKTKINITLIPGGLMSVLTVLLFVAKVWGPMPALSWWWVFAPVLIGPAIVLAVIAAILGALVVAGIVWVVCAVLGKCLS